ncbi:hypothetical protein [Pseudomonas atacamensis]|uniref:hypothetical protein n=1 Tax=Pseudomonas atacamensis TaxID=2565368 RepID=UPI00300F29FC
MLTDRKVRMLLSALLESYPEQWITGYLLDAYISSYCVIGTVYKSLEYRDGALILSEPISQVLEYQHRYLIEISDRERFLIVNFHTHGGRKSLTHLLSLFSTAARLGSRYCLH